MSTVTVCLECGWRSKPGTPGRAWMAVRQHDCERHRVKQIRAERAAARRAATAAKRPTQRPRPSSPTQHEPALPGRTP